MRTTAARSPVRPSPVDASGPPNEAVRPAPTAPTTASAEADDVVASRVTLAKLLAETERLRASVYDAQNARAVARKIVEERENTLAAFDGLSAEIDEFHRENLREQVERGTAPSLSLSRDLADKSAQLEVASGALEAARQYLSTRGKEVADAEAALREHGSVVDKAATNVLIELTRERARSFYRNLEAAYEAFADVTGMIHVLENAGHHVAIPQGTYAVKALVHEISARYLVGGRLQRTRRVGVACQELRARLRSDPEARLEENQ